MQEDVTEARAETRTIPISIEPHGANLNAVTDATRRAASEAAMFGYVAQVWTWRGGEAVMVNECAKTWYGQWVAIVRRGLRRGAPIRVPAGSIDAALTALGIPHRVKSARRKPTLPLPGSRRHRLRVLLRGIHRRGNRRRVFRAKTRLRHSSIAS
jgi:hypothetical protein